MLWAYCTIFKTATRETLYSLATGVKVVISAEIGMLMFRTLHFKKVQNTIELSMTLDLLEEKRPRA